MLGAHQGPFLMHILFLLHTFSLGGFIPPHCQLYLPSVRSKPISPRLISPEFQIHFPRAYWTFSPNRPRRIKNSCPKLNSTFS